MRVDNIVEQTVRREQVVVEELLAAAGIGPGDPFVHSAITKALWHQLRHLRDYNVVAYLAEHQFLPRYGFPIDLVELKTDGSHHGRRRKSSASGHGLRLQRNLDLALSEYIPGSEVVAGKLAYRSAGVLKYWTGRTDRGDLATGWYRKCSSCGATVVSPEGATPDESACGVCENTDSPWRRYLKPEFGFTADANVSARRAYRPEVGIRAGVGSLGINEAHMLRDPVVVNGLELAYVPDGELFFYNQGRCGTGFALCWLCGRAESEGPSATPDDPKTLSKALRPQDGRHRVLWGNRLCDNDGSHFARQLSLGTTIRTDVLRVRDVGRFGPTLMADRSFSESWKAALATAATLFLRVDVREVAGLLVTRSDQGSSVYDVVLYDNTPGGAGHVGQILECFDDLLDEMRSVLRGTEVHDRTCERACQSCLISYQTQRFAQYLDRRSVLRAIG